jgi:hypothetical protein
VAVTAAFGGFFGVSYLMLFALTRQSDDASSALRS